MKNCLKNFVSPFTKIAGAKALVWGAAGLAVSVVCSIFSGWDANGLLHFGSAPTDSWWLSAIHYLIIWLVPAAVFYGLGAALSRSRVRAVDILGTTAFALLPLVPMNLVLLLPCMKRLLAAVTPPLEIERVVAMKQMAGFVPMVFVLMAALILMLVWLMNAVKVSCNLKGWRLWTVYLAGVLGGDIICSLLIGALY